MKIKVIMQYLFDKGGIELVSRALADNNNGVSKRDEAFALDEVYIVMSEEKTKNYVPDFSVQAYRDWRKSRRPDWKDEWINKEAYT